MSSESLIIELSSDSESSNDGHNHSMTAQRDQIPNQNSVVLTDDSTQLPSTSAFVVNAVDFLMETFPVDVDSKSNGAQDLDKNDVTLPEIGDEVNFHYDSGSSECTEASEHNEANEFPVDVDTNSNGAQDSDKSDAAPSEIDDGSSASVSNEPSERNEPSECTDANKGTETTDKNLMFDANLGSSYGFGELNVSILFHFRQELHVNDNFENIG